jgi:nucleoside-diphosphate-sugar epimerase
MAFRVLIIGGTGQVGAAVVRALVAEPSCAEVVMVNRKAIPLTATHRLRQVILDTVAKATSAAELSAVYVTEHMTVCPAVTGKFGMFAWSM